MFHLILRGKVHFKCVDREIENSGGTLHSGDCADYMQLSNHILKLQFEYQTSRKSVMLLSRGYKLGNKD